MVIKENPQEDLSSILKTILLFIVDTCSLCKYAESTAMYFCENQINLQKTLLLLPMKIVII